MNHKRRHLTVALIVSLVFLSSGVFIIRTRLQGESDSSTVSNGEYSTYEHLRTFYGFTMEKKFQKDERATPEEVEEMFHRNKGTVEITFKNKVENKIIFSGYLVPKGHEKPNECVTSRFVVVVGDSSFSDSEVKRIVGLKSDDFSVGNLGNVFTYYPLDSSCKADTEYSTDILFRERIKLRNEIARLMPDLPQGI